MRLWPAFLLLLSFVRSVPDGRVNFKPLSSGMNTNVNEQRQDIIRSKKDFVTLWNELHKTEHMMGDIPPEVNFSKQSVIVCYLGNESSGLSIDSVRNTGLILTIYERNQVFASDCDEENNFVRPFALIAVDGTKWSHANAAVTVEHLACDN